MIISCLLVRLVQHAPALFSGKLIERWKAVHYSALLRF